jgi:hypothetical protein
LDLVDVSTFWWVVVWLLIGFLPFEVYAALSKKKGDTFSENVWDWFGIKKSKPYGPLRRLVLAGFMTSLSAHFIFGTGPTALIVFAVPVAGIIVYSLAKERK